MAFFATGTNDVSALFDRSDVAIEHLSFHVFVIKQAISSAGCGKILVGGDEIFDVGGKVGFAGVGTDGIENLLTAGGTCVNCFNVFCFRWLK